MAQSLEFHEGEPGTCRIASLANVQIVSWTSRATGPAAIRVSDISGRMATGYPRGFSAIHVIANKVGVPTPDGRSGLMKIMTEQSKSLACVAVVVGGSGFWASTMRSFVTGMRFMTPRNFDLRLHGSSLEVLEWLPERHEKITGVSINAAALARVLSSVEGWPNEESDMFARSGGVGT
jgi:hypothetical protein